MPIRVKQKFLQIDQLAMMFIMPTNSTPKVLTTCQLAKMLILVIQSICLSAITTILKLIHPIIIRYKHNLTN